MARKKPIRLMFSSLESRVGMVISRYYSTLIRLSLLKLLHIMPRKQKRDRKGTTKFIAKSINWKLRNCLSSAKNIPVSAASLSWGQLRDGPISLEFLKRASNWSSCKGRSNCRRWMYLMLKQTISTNQPMTMKVCLATPQLSESSKIPKESPISSWMPAYGTISKDSLTGSIKLTCLSEIA